VRATFTGALHTQYRNTKERDYARNNGLTATLSADNKGLGYDRIHQNMNSGAQAINLAFLQGATAIRLLGYDMQNTDGRAHWFNDRPEGLSVGSNYSVFIHNFDKLARDLDREGVIVENYTRFTALHQFPKRHLCEL